MIKLKIAITVLLLALFGVAPAQSQGDLSVKLETNPAAGQIGPDNTFVRTTLTVVDASGQAVSNAYLKLHLDSPPGNPIISTDFPIVEDTALMNYEGILPHGVLEFESIYPIRGQYSFEVEAGRDATALSFKDTLNLSINENSNEVMNGVIFMVLLLVLGLVAGIIIGNGARAQRMAAAGVVLLVLAVGFISSSVSVARAHDGDEVSDVEPFTESATNDDLTLTYTMDPGAGKVGTLNTLTFEATDSSGALVPDTTFEVKFWHIEDDKPVFATKLYAPTGQTRLDFHFFDGAEHEVRLTASNATGTVDLTKVVDVEAVDPPLPVKIKTTIYLVLITFVGILIGLRIQVIRGKNRELAPVGS
jgi:hypothetical protein